MTTATEDRLLKTTEMADRCRVSESTARYWRMIGFGPRSFKVGRRVVYSASDVEAWIAERKAAGNGA
jgi:predicted DNA-binding transcriptional regulator AlpA